MGLELGRPGRAVEVVKRKGLDLFAALSRSERRRSHETVFTLDTKERTVGLSAPERSERDQARTRKADESVRIVKLEAERTGSLSTAI